MNNTKTAGHTAKYILETNGYGNINGIPEGWYEIGNGHAARKIRMANPSIPIYQACIGFNESWGRYSPIIVHISHKDFKLKISRIFNAKKKASEERAKKEAEAIKKALQSRKKIAEALYSLNKEAKRQRNIQERVADSIYGTGERYGELAHYQLHNAKDSKEYLYKLKNEAIHKMVSEWGVTPLGFHEFDSGDKLDYYEIEGYGFHNGDCTSTVHLGMIEGEIEAKRKRSIPPKKAMKIIKAWITT